LTAAEPFFYIAMKNIGCFIFLFLQMSFTLKAQMWDAGWVLGEDDSFNNTTGGGTYMDFRPSPFEMTFIPKRIFFDAANSSVCDKYGNLQFYTNGCVINNRKHEMMENGEIHAGEYTNSFCANGSANFSSAAPQSILALPNYKYDSLYFVISQRLELVTINDTSTTVGASLYLNIVDMRENQGLGKVTQKHIEILADTTFRENLQAIPHANGRDWWLIIPKFRSNCYYVIYLDADGNTKMTEQCLGMVFGLDSWLGQATFSPDGSKFVRFHWKYKLNIFDFDRCNGLLSNAHAIPFPDNVSFSAGCAFSRSSRYLYTTTYTKLFQFDMLAPDIAASRTFIADWDGFNTPFKTKFYMANLALDGKVYVGCPGQHQHIHVINHPELPGIACDFQQHAIELFTSNFWSFPNQAHTRLGPVDGSACDSLGINNNPWAFFRWEEKDTLSPLQVSFIDLSGYQPTSWRWDFGDGASSNETNPLHIYDSIGVYTVCLIVTNSNSSDTLCRVLYLGTSATNEFQSSVQISVTPNPFSDNIFVDLNTDLHSPIFRLYDQIGSLVLENRLTFCVKDLDTRSVQPGIYFWEVSGNQGRLKAGKIIKTSW
jgi:PKD domain